MKRYALHIMGLLTLLIFVSASLMEIYALQTSQSIPSFGLIQYPQTTNLTGADFYRWFFDDYSTGSLPTGWTKVGTGNVQVVKDSSAPSVGSDADHGDVLEIASPQGEEPYVFTGESWGDFVISARVKVISSGPGAVGIYFRYVDSSNWYYFRYGWHDNLFMLYKYIGGVLEGIASVRTSLPLNSWHNWTIQVKGWSVSCLVNQTFIFTNQDLTGHDLSEGKMGLFTWSSTTAHFDNVVYKKSELRLPNRMVVVQLGRDTLQVKASRGLELAMQLRGDAVNLAIQDKYSTPKTIREWLFPFFEAGYYIIILAEYLTDFGYSNNPYIYGYNLKYKNETIVRYQGFSNQKPDSKGYIKLSFDGTWNGGNDAWDIYDGTSPYGDGRKLNTVRDTTTNTWINYLGLNTTSLAWERHSNASGTYIRLYNGTNPVNTSHSFQIYYMTRFWDFIAPTYRSWLNVYKPRLDDLIGNYSMYMDAWFSDCSGMPNQGIVNNFYLQEINKTFLPTGYFSMRDPDGVPVYVGPWTYATFYQGPTTTYNQQLYYRTVIMKYVVGLWRNMSKLFHENYIALGYSTSETQQLIALSQDAGWDFRDDWVNGAPWGGSGTGQMPQKPILIASYCVGYQGQTITDWSNSLFRSLMSNYGLQWYGSVEWWLSTVSYNPNADEIKEMQKAADIFHGYWSLVHSLPRPLLNIAKFHGYYDHTILQGGDVYGNYLLGHLPFNWTRDTYWDINFRGGLSSDADIYWAWVYGAGPLDEVLDKYIIPWLNNSRGALILPTSTSAYSSRFGTSQYDSNNGYNSMVWALTQAYKAHWEARLHTRLPNSLNTTSLDGYANMGLFWASYWDKLYNQTTTQGSPWNMMMLGFRTYGNTGRMMGGRFPFGQRDFPTNLARNSTDNSLLKFFEIFYRGLLWLGRLENVTIFALEGDYTGFVLNSTKDMGIFCMADIFGDTRRPHYTFNITGIGNTFLIYNFTDDTVLLHSNPVTAYLPANAGRYYAVKKYDPSSVNLLYMRRYADAPTKRVLNMGELSLKSDIQTGLRHSTVISGNYGVNASLTYYVPPGLYSNDVFTISCNETLWGYSWNPPTRLLRVWMILENSGSLSIDSGTGTGASMSNASFHQNVLLAVSPREVEDYEEALLLS